jgi:hypothetical protein
MEGSMRVFGLLFCFFVSPVFAGREITTQIHDIDYGDGKNDEVLVFLKSGHVAKLRGHHEVLNSHFMKSKSKDEWYVVKMDDQRVIVDLVKTDPLFEHSPNKDEFLPAPTDYVPTTIASMVIAKRYHREARYNPKDSQCFNRAMIWTYEWWRKHSLKSNKLLIYFSRTYIRRYNFEWWFHIAPYVHVMENGKVVERVLDVKYTNGPRQFQDWANIFLRNDAPCPVITKYSDYADYPYTGECFFQRTHMYTYQPADLQMYEAWNFKKENFILDEVRGAYLEAFDENM